MIKKLVQRYAHYLYSFIPQIRKELPVVQKLFLRFYLAVTSVFLCILPVRKHICGNLGDSGAGGRTTQDAC